jgi:hypothetical protein
MTFVIAGFGKFGRIAMERITRAFPEARIVVVERDFVQLTGILQGITVIEGDVSTVIAGARELRPRDVIIPMVPFNLAAEYILRTRRGLERAPLPDGVQALLPNPHALDDTNVVCSRADFVCPDDCPEGDLCSVTGAPRVPLYRDLESLSIPECVILTQRSQQILPGIGGYTMESLESLASRVKSGRYLIATSCKCHAILTCIQAKGIRK